jgi:hypothetical protein
MMCGNDDNSGDDGNSGNNDQNDSHDSHINQDEFDVDMTPESGVEGETEVEYLGRYDSIDAYLHSQVELLILPDGMWLLYCIDFLRVQEMMTDQGAYRIWRDPDGRLFRGPRTTGNT